MAFLGINQFRPVGLRFVCWFYDGNTQRLKESGFMEKPEIEPATPGLQDIGLSPTPQRLLYLNLKVTIHVGMLTLMSRISLTLMSRINFILTLFITARPDSNNDLNVGWLTADLKSVTVPVICGELVIDFELKKVLLPPREFCRHIIS